MSERNRKRLGFILLSVSFLLTIIPCALRNPRTGKRYRAGENQTRILSPIPIERNGPVRINEADTDTLQELPGIGPVYAERIVAERERNGFFYYPEDLETVSGIGPRTVEKIRSLIDMETDKGGD